MVGCQRNRWDDIKKHIQNTFILQYFLCSDILVFNFLISKCKYNFWTNVNTCDSIICAPVSKGVPRTGEYYQ